MKRKKKHKFGRRRTNTYDGETHVHNRTKILRHGNSDTEDLSVTDESSGEDDIDKFATKCSVKNGEDLPLLGALSINNCQVTLADRSKAYLCKNLDLEADDVSITYDVPNTRRSVTYSNAGTFPMPDAKRVGHYDEPNDEANASQLGEDRWDAAGGVRRSRSWYLCCPGSGLAERPANEETTNLDGDRIATITNAPSPGENQYLHLAAVSSLKNEVLELSARLHAAHRDRDSAREALCAAQGECGRLRNTLALQARSSEERMTELHGVIAELRRLCSARDRAAIQELREEDSEVETSCRDNSVTGASDRTTSLGDADETASVHNDQAPETPTSPAALPVPEFPPAQQPQQSQQLSQQLYTPSPHPDTDTSNRNLAPADSTSFDEEETIEIDRRLRCRRRPSPRSPRRNNTGEQSPREPQQQQDQRHPHDREEDEQLQQRFPSLALSRQHSPCVRSGVIPSTSPQTKIASRVRLRRTHEDARLTGKDICQEGVYSSAVAEHLTRGSTSHCEEEGEGEERLNARLDRLEADNMLLAVTLRESKEHADRLSLACAQCSAEAGALRMALAAADRAVEAYDVLLALAETSEHTQDGLGSGNTVRMRVATERVARGLLARLDGEAHGQLRAEAVGPWADPAAMLLYQCDNDGSAWTPGEEERLRGHVSRLKRERTVAASGAQPAQWPLLDDGDGIDDNLSGAARGSDKMRCLDAADARKLDMETAVLMQEVMSLREERAELRARLRSLRPPGTRQTNSLSGAEEGESERRLLEALARENTLKTRLQRLMASVNQANCNMDNNEEVKKCPRCGTQPGRNIPWEEVQLERTVGEDPPALAPPVVASEQMNDGVAYESQTTTHQL